MASTATLERPTSKSVTPVKPYGWLDDLVAKGRKEPFAETMTISPALAAELLNRNEDNRVIKAAKVANFAADMSSGRWAFNGEPIIISDTGELNDGQHRLTALIQADTALSFLVVFGVPRNTRTTLDQGSTRGAQDYLAMEGRPYANNAATLARYVLAYERSEGRNLHFRSRITNAEVVERVRDDEGITASAAYGFKNLKAYRHLVGHSVLATAHYLLSKVSPADAETYLEQVCIGENIERGDPAFTVRAALASERRYRDEALEIILTGWNRFRTRQPMQRARINGVLPTIS
jgi:hypothetical protein